MQIYNLYFNYQKNLFLFYREMAKNSVFGSKDSYFGRIFDLSHFLGRNVNLSIRERKARYGAKNGQTKKAGKNPA
jgi:hypothetical protein